MQDWLKTYLAVALDLSGPLLASINFALMCKNSLNYIFYQLDLLLKLTAESCMTRRKWQTLDSCAFALTPDEKHICIVSFFQDEIRVTWEERYGPHSTRFPTRWPIHLINAQFVWLKERPAFLNYNGPYPVEQFTYG